MFTIEESSEQHLNPVYRLHNLQDPQSTIHNPQFTIQNPEVRIIQNQLSSVHNMNNILFWNPEPWIQNLLATIQSKQP